MHVVQPGLQRFAQLRGKPDTESRRVLLQGLYLFIYAKMFTRDSHYIDQAIYISTKSIYLLVEYHDLAWLYIF